MDFSLDNLLNLPHVTVLSYQQQEEFIFLKLELLNEGILCPHCQTYTADRETTRLNYTLYAFHSVETLEIKW